MAEAISVLFFNCFKTFLLFGDKGLVFDLFIISLYVCCSPFDNPGNIIFFFNGFLLLDGLNPFVEIFLLIIDLFILFPVDGSPIFIVGKSFIASLGGILLFCFDNSASNVSFADTGNGTPASLNFFDIGSCAYTGSYEPVNSFIVLLNKINSVLVLGLLILLWLER